ncbi:MAG: hypothetical protein ACR2K1_11230 [Saprospiraceae bacterium]
MNKIPFIARLLAVVLFISACQSPPPGREEKIAAAYCECMTRLVQMNKEMQSNVGKDTSEQAIALFRALENAYNEAKECSGTLIGQFGKLKPEELPAIEKILAQKCPELAAQHDLLQEMLGE